MSGRDEAEALLGMPLTSLKIMRLEAQRARDVVDGKKTLELTGRKTHERGVVLIGETADGAIAKHCAIGAVTLGECTRMTQEDFEATADRHHALDFAPAQAWLEKGTMYAQELSDAVRFERPVPYANKAGARKWYAAITSPSPHHHLTTTSPPPHQQAQLPRAKGVGGGSHRKAGCCAHGHGLSQAN